MVKKGVARIKDEYSCMVFTRFTNEGIIYKPIYTRRRQPKTSLLFLLPLVALRQKKIPLPIALNGFTASRLLPALLIINTTMPTNKQMALEHKHVIIRAEVLNPPNDEEQASNQVKDLIERIGMKILMGPYAKYCTMVGNRGLTVAAIIETSHVVMHVWDENAPALVQLDVYTCGPFDKSIVFKWLQQYKPTNLQYKYLDREHGLKTVTSSRTKYTI